LVVMCAIQRINPAQVLETVWTPHGFDRVTP
jgi:hypothetical protein